MGRLRSFAICLVAASVLHAGDEPDWVRQPGKSVKFPASQYLIGYGSASVKSPDAIRIAEDNARGALSAGIVTHIKSDIVTKLEESGKKASEYFSSVTQSSTSLQISGLKTEIYKDKKLVHALAYVSRSELVRIYSKKKSDLVNQMQAIIENAKRDESDKKIDAAAVYYLSLYPLYDEWSEVNSILLVADNQNMGLPEEPGLMSRTGIALKIDQLLAQSISSVDDAARAVAYLISKQLKGSVGKVIVSPLTYQDSKMSSDFARYFRQTMESQLQKYSVWEIAQQAKSFEPKTSQITRDLVMASGAQNLFEGNYWEQGDKIKIIGRLRDVASGKILASAEVVFDAALLGAVHLTAKPENYIAALADQKAFAKDEVVSSDIQLEVWTNKGSEDLFYSEGEIMKVLVRSNRACHVRILYTFADGTRTLLFNDHFIDEGKANQVVEIPGEFECTAPFGAETMIVCASIRSLPEVKTVDRDGVLYLEEKDPQKAAYNVRGFKKKQPGEENVQQTEKRLTITTIAR